MGNKRKINSYVFVVLTYFITNLQVTKNRTSTILVKQFYNIKYIIV